MCPGRLKSIDENVQHELPGVAAEGSRSLYSLNWCALLHTSDFFLSITAFIIYRS